MITLSILNRSLSSSSKEIVRCYTIALARRVSSEISDGITLKVPTTNDENLLAASYEIADKQHQSYIQTMRSIVPTLELPSLPNHPDCCFVEDTLVAVDRTVVITNPGHDARRGEVATMRNIAHQLGMRVIDMKEKKSDATLDGGDVLNTGRHMYVGLTNRTNSNGFRVLEEVFGDVIRVIPVQLPTDFSSTLHLKSVVTHLDDETLLVPAGREKVLKCMLDSGGYECIIIPDASLANVVVVNGNVLAQKTTCEESNEILKRACKERKLQLHWLNLSELAKVDGALTCLSVLLNI